MLLKKGDKILVAHRRLFENDEERFFAGQVEDYESGVGKSRGHSYVRDVIAGQVIEKAEERTKILSLSSGTLLVYQLPDTVALDALKFTRGGPLIADRWQRLHHESGRAHSRRTSIVKRRRAARLAASGRSPKDRLLTCAAH